MNLRSVNCASCGAPLHIATHARRITCGHCGVQLSVNQDCSTSLLDRICSVETRHEQLDYRVTRLEQEPTQYPRPSRAASRRVPADTTPLGLTGTVAAAIAGIAFLRFALSFPLFPLVFLIAGITAYARMETGKMRTRSKLQLRRDREERLAQNVDWSSVETVVSPRAYLARLERVIEPVSTSA